MRILIISDIHANITALKTVIHSAGYFDATWCLGDLVGYGPDPNEVIEEVRKLPNLVCLLGNHDAATLGRIEQEAFNHEARMSVDWMRRNVTPDNMQYLKSLPERIEIDEVTLTHGSPRNPVWEYLLERKTAEDNFASFATRLCFVGHTHIPVVYAKNSDTVIKLDIRAGSPWEISSGRAFLNPGSVGQPRDHDAKASYAIYDPNENTWELRRVKYDFHQVQERIFKTDLPRRNGTRLAGGW